MCIGIFLSANNMQHQNRLFLRVTNADVFSRASQCSSTVYCKCFPAFASGCVLFSRAREPFTASVFPPLPSATRFPAIFECYAFPRPIHHSHHSTCAFTLVTGYLFFALSCNTVSFFISIDKYLQAIKSIQRVLTLARMAC